MVTNPMPALLALKDSVKMTDDQVTQLKTLSDSLDAKLKVRRDSLRSALAAIDLSPLRRQAAQMQQRMPSALGRDFSDGPMMGNRGPSNDVLQTMQKLQKVTGPITDSARADVARSLVAARKVLQPAQWEKLPFAVRVPSTGGAGGGRGGFNGAGMVDRMLANPLPVLLELKDTLKLSSEQVTKIQAISDKLGARLNKQREALGKKFDNVNANDQARVFADIQPAIQTARQDVQSALQDVRKVLTADQWEKLPSEIANPFARRGPGR
ncbi:MAG TPA: hypothetical protein VF832_18895, partial [Longimicrobiales bacterium]